VTWSEWLTADAIVLDDEAASVAEVIAAAASPLAASSGLPAARIEAALLEAATESRFALGCGVAVPHVGLADLDRRSVCLVRVAKPLDVGALDSVPVDLFFVVIYPVEDPRGHLNFLAHLASLCTSRLYREALRSAASPAEIEETIAAAESRQMGRARPPAQPAVERLMVVISISGERALDTLLVELLDRNLGGAFIMEAQSVHEAARREVPLFAGFRDLFGDPGGQRLIIAIVDADGAGAITEMVERVCEDRNATQAQVVVVPIGTFWQWAPPAKQG
jgi:mannitol/fructose-specific phosphotransferase system IIA component (Ntr-type)